MKRRTNGGGEVRKSWFLVSCFYEGRPDLAAQVHKLFTTVNPGSEI